jgi:hypothetical protein
MGHISDEVLATSSQRKSDIAITDAELGFAFEISQA